MFIVITWTAIYIGVPEMFPVSNRARSSSVASAIGKLGGFLAAHCFARLPDDLSILLVSSSFGIASLLSFFGFPETAGTTLV